jgi:hypothetical protein
MKYIKEELDVVICRLKNLSLNINTLPREIFQDIWIKLDVTMYSDIKIIEEKIPAIKEYIQECVTELEFDRDTFNLLIKEYDSLITEVYPNLKYVDCNYMEMDDITIKKISQLNHLRNVRLVGSFNCFDNVALLHDIMINIIKRNKGNVKVSLEIRNLISNMITYKNGIIDVSRNCLTEKIKLMRPEILTINNPFNHIDVLKLALLPTIRGLRININLNDKITSPNIPNVYSILNTLLYIDEDSTPDLIEKIYKFGPHINMIKKRESKIENIQYKYVDEIQDEYIIFDHNEYWAPLQDCSQISDQHIPVKTFPTLKVMTVPIDDDNMESWRRIAPNVKNLRSRNDAYIEGANKKIEKLKLEIRACKDFIHDINLPEL